MSGVLDAQSRPASWAFLTMGGQIWPFAVLSTKIWQYEYMADYERHETRQSSAFTRCDYRKFQYILTPQISVYFILLRFRFQKLEKWRKPFYDVLQAYGNSSVVLPAFYNTRNTDVSFRVKYMLDDFDSQKGVFFFHPQYLLNVQRFWSLQGVRAKRLSSGLMLVTAAMELCEEVHLYGFWAFPMNPAGIFITHHYYDNVKPRPGFHAMPHEIFNFLHLHSRGILQVHTGPCR